MKKLILSLLVVFSVLIGIVSAADLNINPLAIEFGEVEWEKMVLKHLP